MITALEMLEKMLSSSYFAVDEGVRVRGDMVYCMVDVNGNEIVAETMDGENFDAKVDSSNGGIEEDKS